MFILSYRRGKTPTAVESHISSQGALKEANPKKRRAGSKCGLCKSLSPPPPPEDFATIFNVIIRHEPAAPYQSVQNSQQALACGHGRLAGTTQLSTSCVFYEFMAFCC
jgi:hypothetical protein